MSTHIVERERERERERPILLKTIILSKIGEDHNDNKSSIVNDK